MPRNPPGAPPPLAFAPDGALLAVIGKSGREVRLVDPGTGQELVVLSAPNPQLIVSLAFRPDGRRIAAGCHNGVVHLWDLTAIRTRLAALKLDWGPS